MPATLWDCCAIGKHCRALLRLRAPAERYAQDDTSGTRYADEGAIMLCGGPLRVIGSQLQSYVRPVMPARLRAPGNAAAMLAGK